MANVNVKVGYTIDKTGLNEIKKQLADLRVEAKTADVLGNLTPQLKEAGQAAAKLEDILNSAWNSKIGQLDMGKVNTEIIKTWKSADNLGKTLINGGKNGAIAFSSFASTILNSNIQLKQSSQLLDKMAITLKNTVRYGISSSIFNILTNSIRKAYDYTVKLDTSLNDIRIVTGKSADEMDRFAIRANKVAKDLGRSTKDFTDAALIYYQQGLGNEEAQARAEVTMKAANVTGQSGREVSEQLTAVWNGYKVSADETEAYVDKLSAVAATTAADLEELSTGMSKVASAANLMGVDVDQLNAQLATIVSVTKQAPESVGVALKTIYARMSDIKSGLDDETTLGNYTEKMAQYGINVLDANNNLRDMGDVIEEIGGKWNKLSREQQVALAQTMAGTRQYNNLLSLFDNWDMYTKALDTSKNSLGELQRQQDIYMQSTKAHLEQLATEAEKTYSILFDQDSIRGFIDIMNDALSLLNTYLKGLGGGMQTITTLGLQVANVFSNQISGSISRQVENKRIQKNNADVNLLRSNFIESYGISDTYENLEAPQKARVDTEVKYAQEIGKVEDVLTEKEAQQLTEQQRQTAELTEQLEIYKQIRKEIVETLGLTEDDDFAEALTNELEESGDKINRINQKLADTEKATAKIEQRQQKLNDKKEKTGSLTEDEEKQLQDLNDELEDQKTLEGNFKDELEQEKQHYNELNNLNQKRGNITDEVIENTEKGRDSINNSINDTIRLKKEQQSINNVLKGTTTILSTITTSIGIIKTLNDDNLSGWEKFGSVVTALGAQAAMIAMNYSSLKTMMADVVKLLGVETVVTDALAKAREDAVAAGMAENLTRAQTLKITLGVIATKIKEIALDAMEATSKKILITLQTILNALTGNFGPIAAAAAIAITGIVAALSAWAINMTIVDREENKLNNAIKETQEKIQKTQNAYNELKDTISTYTDAKKAINDLEEGTIEFYEAIQKANKAAQELIDTWGLVIGQDYVLNSNGLININPETLQNKQFQAQQEIYRSQAQNYAARSNYIRQSSQGGLPGVYSRFANEVNKIFAANGISGYKINSNQSESILKGENLASNQIVNELQKINTNTQNFGKTLNNNVDKIPTKINESAHKDTIYITDAVKQFKNEYNKLNAQATSLDYQAADATIRGYGTKAQVDRYNSMSGIQQNIAQQYVLSRQAQQASSNTVKDTSFFGNIAAGAAGGAAVGSTFFGIGAIPGALAGGLGGLIGSFIGQGKIDKFYREEYLKSTKDYQKNTSGQWINDSGSVISDDQIKKDLDAIDLEIAKSAYQRGEAITKAAYAEFESKLDKNIDSVTKITGENGERKFDDNSTQYLGSAITAAQEGLDFDYSILGENELNYLKENIDNLNVSTEAYNTILETTSNIAKRLNADLQEYNSILKAQAEESGTTTSALELYGYAMRNAGDITGDLNKQTAEAIAGSYKFNKAFNEAQKSYLDNKDALDLYSKALEEHGDISYDVADAIGELKDKVEDMFDGAEISSKVFSENLSLIETLLTGTQEEADAAYNTLSRMIQENALVDAFGAASDTLFKLEYDTDKVCKSIMTSTQSLYEGLIDAIDNTNPGKKLNAEFAGQLAAMINNADMTVTEIQALADSLNLDIPMEVSTNAKDITIKTAKWTSGAQIVQHTYQGEAPDPKDPSKNVKVNYAWVETIEDKTEEFGIPVVKGDQIKVRDNARSNGGGNRGTRRNFTPSMGNTNAGKKSNGGGSSKQPDKMDPLKKEKDRYHDVDIQLKQIKTDLDKLDKQKKKLFGQDLINNLNKRLGLLNKQIDRTNDKIKIAQGETQELKDKLSGKGVSFNADGTIANYAAAYASQLNYVNSLIAQYNSMSAEAQEGFKDTVEKAKEDFDKFVDNINKYDTLITDTIPGLEADIQNAVDEKIDLQIEKFDMEIEIRLDLAEAERDWNEFKKKIIDGIEDDDILGNAMARLVDFSSYYKEDNTGIVQALRKQVDNTLAELNQMDTNGWSNVYGDNRTAALDDLQKYYKELMDNLTDVLELQKEIHESYIDMMDEAQEKFDEQIEAYEMISDLIEHDMEVISLVYGEQSYGQLAKYYDKQQQNFNSQLDFQRQQADFWRQQLDTLEEGSDEWENARKKWKDAVQSMNDLIEKSIQNLQDKYLNAINLIFQNLNNKITDNLGLEYIEEEWNLINKNADQYLDTINSLYEVQKLEGKYLDALDQTDSISAQRQLKKIMDEELADLRERDKLTQYDIERANKKYEIALKQIALQEAQQNKSKMRLRRDSQGNYRYEYTADGDQVGQLQDELNDMYNSLYNFDKARYQDNLNQMYDVWVEFQEKMAEAAQINDPVARSERELLLQNQYEQLINGLTEQNATVRENLHESTFDDLSRLYDVNVANFQNMSDEEKDVLMSDLLPYWESGVQHMTDVFAGDDGFLGVCKDAFDQLHDATKDYEDGLDELENTGRIDFESIGEGIDENINRTQQLISDNTELINSYEQELTAIGNVITQLDDLVNKYNAAKDAAIAATKAAYEYWSEQQRQAAAAASNANGGSGSGNGSSGSSSGSSGKAGGSGSGGDGNLVMGDTATFSGRYYYDSYGTSPVGSKYSGVANGVVVDRITNNPYGIHIHSADGRYPDLGWVKRSQLSGYDTGGYTGEWGSDGRLALLHQKELVLNKEDTANMLNAISIMRNITNMLGSSVLGKLAAATAGGLGTEVGGDVLEQNVHIDAQFPNVKDSREIEEALNNLVNMASMRANRR